MRNAIGRVGMGGFPCGASRVLRGVVGAAPYGSYQGWYEIVGTAIGRPQRDEGRQDGVSA